MSALEYHQAGCAHLPRMSKRPAKKQLCLAPSEVEELGRLLLAAESVMGMPVEIEWALDGAGIKLLQSRPLHLDDQPDDGARPDLAAPAAPARPAGGRGLGHGPRLRGQLRVRDIATRSGRRAGDEDGRAGAGPRAVDRRGRSVRVGRQHVPPRLARPGALRSHRAGRAGGNPADTRWRAGRRGRRRGDRALDDNPAR